MRTVAHRESKQPAVGSEQTHGAAPPCTSEFNLQISDSFFGLSVRQRTRLLTACCSILSGAKSAEDRRTTERARFGGHMKGVRFWPCFAALALTLATSGCYTAEHAVDKAGRVTAHGLHKTGNAVHHAADTVERHTP